MNNLESLIQKYCPNGVKYKKLNNLCIYIRGVTYNKSKENNINDNNSWRVLRANNIDLKTNKLILDDIKYIKKEVKVKPEQFLIKNDILICAGSGSKEHIGKVAFINEDIDFTFGGFMGVIRCNNYLNARFLFYILTSSFFKNYLIKTLNATTINNLNATIIYNCKIPVPPLLVQEEVVSILDSFTEVNEELNKKLNEELNKRKKQYEYYKDKLLTFKELKQ